jgi:hypothetical protein
MGTIIVLIISAIILFVFAVILSSILQKYPFLVWILSLIVGGFVWIIFSWWLGLIVGLIAIGIFYKIMVWTSPGRCPHCISYNTVNVNVSEDEYYEMDWGKERKPSYHNIERWYRCNNCGHYTAKRYD